MNTVITTVLSRRFVFSLLKCYSTELSSFFFGKKNLRKIVVHFKPQKINTGIKSVRVSIHNYIFIDKYMNFPVIKNSFPHTIVLRHPLEIIIMFGILLHENILIANQITNSECILGSVFIFYACID